MIQIINNTPLINHTEDYDIILLGTNCYQVLRNGFQYDIAKKYPYIRKMNNQTKYADISKVGNILECKKETKPIITLLYISFGYNFKGNNNEYVDYEGLTRCLRLCNLLYKDKHVATTMLGCTNYDGNGNKDKVLEIINKTITNFNLDIYDYQQDSYQEIKRKELIELKKQTFGINFKERKYDKKINP